MASVERRLKAKQCEPLEASTMQSASNVKSASKHHKNVKIHPTISLSAVCTNKCENYHILRSVLVDLGDALISTIRTFFNLHPHNNDHKQKMMIIDHPGAVYAI